MYQRHLRGDIGKVQRFFHGGVAPAYNNHFLVAIEKAIASGAGRNTLTHKLLLSGQPQVTGAGTGRNNQRIAGVGAAVTFQGVRFFA